MQKERLFKPNKLVKVIDLYWGYNRDFYQCSPARLAGYTFIHIN